MKVFSKALMCQLTSLDRSTYKRLDRFDRTLTLQWEYLLVPKRMHAYGAVCNAHGYCTQESWEFCRSAKDVYSIDRINLVPELFTYPAFFHCRLELLYINYSTVFCRYWRDDDTLAKTSESKLATIFASLFILLVAA